jgi:hypothetical protein
MRPLACTSLVRLGVAALLPTCAFAQSPAATSSTPVPNVATSTRNADLPSSPRGWLQLADKSNGIGSNDAKPWHIKISFTLYDQDGKEANHGVYENFWAGPNKCKIIHQDDKYSETQYETVNGVAVVGDHSDISGKIVEISDQFMRPLHTSSGVRMPRESATVAGQIRQVENETLRCITITYPDINGYSRSALGWTACTDVGGPTLRFVFGPPGSNRQYTFNNAKLFDGRYIAHEILGSQNGKLYFKARLETIENIESIDDALFTPPPGAKVMPPRAVQITPSPRPQ